MEKSNNETISNSIFKEELPDINSILKKYPNRVLPNESMVTRFAPSPTGFLHIGGVYMALISERFAHQTNGVYFVRIEDTDQKRKRSDAEDIINNGLEYFNLCPDEGPTVHGMQGNYGPYRQSERENIYKAFVRKLILEGKVYPCFASEEELAEMRKRQTEMSIRPGYYGVWAKWRDADPHEVEKMLKEDKPYVLRFKSNGNPDKRVLIEDLIKGRIEMPENDIDVVVLKKDGLPTYHFAHVIDDFLMKPTHIIRADEWVSSTPLHFQLSDALGFPRMKYGHISPINRLEDDGGKRKLSKRKDPEANVEYYQKAGYPKIAVIEYLMNLANSEFEDWRKNNPEKPYIEFEITFKRLSQSTGPLFNEVKLRDISKQVISKMSVEEFNNNVIDWSFLYDQELNKKLTINKEYWLKIFSIERGSDKRKDIAIWSEVYEFYKYFDIETFTSPQWDIFETTLTADEVKQIKKETTEQLSSFTSAEEFMNFMRTLAKRFNLAENIKEFKASQGKMRGHVGLVSQVIRYAITGRTNTPDLFQIIQVLGEEEVKKRLVS